MNNSRLRHKAFVRELRKSMKNPIVHSVQPTTGKGKKSRDKENPFFVYDTDVEDEVNSDENNISDEELIKELERKFDELFGKPSQSS